MFWKEKQSNAQNIKKQKFYETNIANYFSHKEPVSRNYDFVVLLT